MNKIKHALMLLVLALAYQKVNAQGGVSADWHLINPNGQLVAYQFSLVGGFPFASCLATSSLSINQQQAPAWGYWSFYQDKFYLRSGDQTLKFSGTFDSTPVCVPIDNNCTQISGTLTGTFKDSTAQHKWTLNAHAIYSQTACVQTNNSFIIGWLGGGNFTIFTPNK